MFRALIDMAIWLYGLLRKKWSVGIGVSWMEWPRAPTLLIKANIQSGDKSISGLN